MEGNLQDPTDKNDFMVNHIGASLGWLEEGDCSEGSFEFDDVSIFLSNESFLEKAQQPMDGGHFLSLNKGLLPPPPDLLLVGRLKQDTLTPSLWTFVPQGHLNVLQALSLLPFCCFTFTLHHSHHKKLPMAETIIDKNVFSEKRKEAD